jgi:hypothetical protein
MTRAPLLFALAALALGGGCAVLPDAPSCSVTSDCPTEHVCGEDGICREDEPLLQSLVVNDRPRLDLLFVIDNSGSMCDEQDDLAEAYGAFLGVIDSTFGLDRVDMRLAVTSTDMQNPEDRGRFLARPAPPGPSPSCDVAATGVQFDVRTAGCDEIDLPPIFSTDEITDLAEAQRRVRCMLTLGTNGDGFEKGLEASRQALSCDGPNAAFFGACCEDGVFDPACEVTGADAPRFLRPDAQLLLVYFSDEDDCSDPVSNPRADLASCEAAGCAISRDSNSSCEWDRERLTPVDEYAEFLRSLKKDPSAVNVLAITGPRFLTDEGWEVYLERPESACDSIESCNEACDAPTGDDETAPTGFVSELGVCCPRGVCEGPVVPVCRTARGDAYSGKRYQTLADLFGLFGETCVGADCPSICSDDYQAQLLKGLELAQRALALMCLDEAPLCVVDGRSCARADELAEPANYDVDIKLTCPEGADQATCDRIDSELRIGTSSCTTGFGLNFTEPLPLGTEVIARYRRERPRKRVELEATDLPIAIPDGSAEAVSTLAVDRSGNVARARVSLRIAHPTRGDLTVSLRHGETEQVLSAEEGKSADNLEGVFVLDDFLGTSAAGDWSLVVRDGFPIHSGEIRAWALELELE